MNLPDCLQPVAHRKVPNVVLDNDEATYGALLDVQSNGKKHWTVRELKAAHNEFMGCRLTVAEFAEQKALQFANEGLI